MERIKRNRRFLGIVLINFAICIFAVFHVPVLVPVEYVSRRVCLRFASLFVYTFIYVFVLLGANIRRTVPGRVTRKVVEVG